MSTPTTPQSPTEKESAEAIKYYSASQWQLVWWRFRRHRLAMTGTFVLGLMAFLGIFANFIAPYGTGPLDGMRDTTYILGPPQIPYFANEQGFSWQPHIYAVTTQRDPETLRPIPTPLLIYAYADQTPPPACSEAEAALDEAEDEFNILTDGDKLVPFQEAVNEACFAHIYRPIEFFVRGDAYRFFGVIPSDWHLFGLGPIDEALLVDLYGQTAVDEMEAEIERANRGKIHLFGTGSIGDDLFSQVMFATRTSLSIGVFGVLISFVLALIIGGTAGYFGGWVDYFIQRFTEVVRVIPTIPLYMGMAAAFPKEWSNMQVYFFMTLVLGLFGWPTLARRIRGQLLSLRNDDYILAARLAGSKPTRIIGRHLLPAFTSYIIVDLVISFPYMILSETALSFIGLGLRRPTLSWGVLLQDAQSVQALEQAPWLFIPVAFVVVAVLAFTLMGDGLRDAADPYS